MGRALKDGPILALMAMQLTIWAALFYVFPALVLEWQAEFGWSQSELMRAFTLSIAVYALGAPIYGRLIDRGLAPVSFPAGAIGAALSLTALVWVESLWAFTLIWTGLGVAMGLTLYEACFAIVTRARSDRARDAITAITLVGGFASTLAYPASAFLVEMGGWRLAIWGAVAMILIVNLPLALYAIPRLEAEARVAGTTPAASRTTDVSVIRRVEYWPLAIGFALAAFASGAVLSNLLPLMAAQGVPDGLAILAAALLGPSQVAGRLAMIWAGKRAAALRIAQAAMLSLALGAALLAGSGLVAVLVIGFAVAQGGGYGVVGILRAVVTRETLGQHRFGAVSGAVSLPSLLAFAFAPYLSASIADAAGHGTVIGLCIVAPVIGAAILLLLPSSGQKSPRPR